MALSHTQIQKTWHCRPSFFSLFTDGYACYSGIHRMNREECRDRHVDRSKKQNAKIHWMNPELIGTLSTVLAIIGSSLILPCFSCDISDISPVVHPFIHIFPTDSQLHLAGRDVLCILKWNRYFPYQNPQLRSSPMGCDEVTMLTWWRRWE